MTHPVARVKLKIVGKVQGVFFRQSTKQKAESLGLSGWVRNECDGSVGAEVVGLKPLVEELIEWCYEGPPSARVIEVCVEWVEGDQNPMPTGKFEVVHDG